jgi:hypothetical protein
LSEKARKFTLFLLDGQEDRQEKDEDELSLFSEGDAEVLEHPAPRWTRLGLSYPLDSA